MSTITPLPVYPSTQARKGFSASQLAQFRSNVSDAIEQVITLPPAKQDTPSTRSFISSYASDAAQQALEALIWQDTEPTSRDDRIRQRVLLLAEKVAPGLELGTLLDLSISFPSKIARLRSILSAALGGTPDLPRTCALQVVPAFTALLSPARSSGLYGLRKTARCLLSLLRPAPLDLIRPFAHSEEFIITLARAYDDGLTAIARSYGGMRMAPDRELDHWEKIWLDTKVDMIDAFHVIMAIIVRDISSASGAALAAEADRTFGIMFELLDLLPQSTNTDVASASAVPFLSRSLVADYQYAYDLGGTLSSALSHASRDDARMELLESTLRSLDGGLSGGKSKDAGALKLILCSSGIVAASHEAGSVQPSSNDKGKTKATTAPDPSPLEDVELDSKVSQVLDILPDHSPEYIRKLLVHPSFPFRGNAERVIEALLEGTAPDEVALGNDNNTVESSHTISAIIPSVDTPIERRNVFDEEAIDLKRVHIGKKTQDDTSLTRDKAEIERMKADIIRRAEAILEDSEDEGGYSRALDVIDLDDDLENTRAGTVNVLGDGEDSGDEEVSGEHRVDPMKPETILELAYLRDPKLFDRDAQTRRSKSRSDLKQQTGWTDEQIEGWRIMLERNPKKERILQKHEFSGNRAISLPVSGGSGDQPSGVHRGGGGGRGRGRGRGRGSGGETKEDVARERAFKERHKSNNRKRGHDKKVARGGAGPST